MAKREIRSDKFYLGYPVLIVLATAASGELLARTITSSYTLDDAIFMGFGKDGNFAEVLKVGQRLSVNIVSSQQGLLSDIAGAFPREKKLSALTDAGARLTENDGVPLLENTPLSLICQLTEVHEIGDYVHVSAKISTRLLDDKLISADSVNWPAYQPLIYMGDRNNRAVYKQLGADATPVGSFLKFKKEARSDE
ncbi:MAG: flavin reductase family protein [Streptococcaceae bacterium]|jgi:flavin reductase (DIM6/NTAB) family NADH-FMN oxidoreductase RutF|nr:flavin reductase family protein [Streptococcaceae bacterium]